MLLQEVDFDFSCNLQSGQIIFILNVILFSFVFSKHHQSFDPFQGQKEASFRGLEESAISLALFLDHSVKNSDISDRNSESVKSTFDTLLQVGRDLVKFVSLNKIKEIAFANHGIMVLHVCYISELNLCIIW